ncbi:lysis protein [Xenorhabdus lircayensis]|uniref:Lysis protein n=1 Tax=Xenorhabdus lircayensis TaxID=2763499 RepID=A0ABS0U3Y9_9GAMM|nr:lysis protein [Xenorhabdus lircayensis]MBI6548606.1 lysis protein [Xenorhabdus lircayensis]
MKKLLVVLVTALGVASFAVYHYRSGYNKQLGINGNQKTEIQQLTDRINHQNTHIEMLHELDTKHTQELANAKTEIDTLRADVAAGRRKLRIKANCPVSETAPSGSMGDGTPVEITGETGSTVLDIREGIINDRAKLRYLQGYINTECRGNDGKSTP